MLNEQSLYRKWSDVRLERSADLGDPRPNTGNRANIQVMTLSSRKKLSGMGDYPWTLRAGLSIFFGIPLVPGLVHSQVGKSGAMTIKSRFYSFPSILNPKSLKNV